MKDLAEAFCRLFDFSDPQSAASANFIMGW